MTCNFGILKGVHIYPVDCFRSKSTTTTANPSTPATTVHSAINAAATVVQDIPDAWDEQRVKE